MTETDKITDGQVIIMLTLATVIVFEVSAIIGTCLLKFIINYWVM